MDFQGAALPLKPDDIRLVAGYLGCEIAALHAVIEVESNGAAFKDGRPVILNEPHVFYRELDKISRAKRDQAVSAGLAYKKWGTRKYLRTQAKRYDWLADAMEIDKAAALKSCSWGMGQVMGFNHEVCGFEDVHAFVGAMMHSQGAQLMVIGRFIVGNKLQRHLVSKDWAKFARGYNGSGYAKHGYHTKLARAYAKRPESERVTPPPTSIEQLEAMMGKTTFVHHDVAEPAPSPTQPQHSWIDVLASIFQRLFASRQR